MNTFPIDDYSLTLLREACDASLVVEEDGTHSVVNGEFTLTQLLDFFSGYNPEESEEVGINIYEYTGGTMYSYSDVIRALTDEIFRLRGVASNGPSEP